jgi:SagB-type dehydrogenase family enzyme
MFPEPVKSETSMGRSNSMTAMESYRQFLKADRWDEWEGLETDQDKQVPRPLLQKPYPKDATLVDLIPAESLTVGHTPLIEVVKRRRSRREFTEQPLTLEELSFLLWATQGKSGYRDDESLLRTVPSAGARHPFETYLTVHRDRVDGLEPGLYRYLSLEHQLCFLFPDRDLAAKVADACRGQDWISHAAVVFVWTVIPYRTEWRYDMLSHKVIALDAGHVCQNLYLASGAVGAGACAVGAYTQQAMDALLGVDGKEEFSIYVAPVGKI